MAPSVTVTVNRLPSWKRNTPAPVGHYNPDQTLRVTFGLKRPHADEEEQFLDELQASPPVPGGRGEGRLCG